MTECLEGEVLQTERYINTLTLTYLHIELTGQVVFLVCLCSLAISWDNDYIYCQKDPVFSHAGTASYPWYQMV